MFKKPGSGFGEKKKILKKKFVPSSSQEEQTDRAFKKRVSLFSFVHSRSMGCKFMASASSTCFSSTPDFSPCSFGGWHPTLSQWHHWWHRHHHPSVMTLPEADLCLLMTSPSQKCHEDSLYIVVKKNSIIVCLITLAISLRRLCFFLKKYILILIQIRKNSDRFFPALWLMK